MVQFHGRRTNVLLGEHFQNLCTCFAIGLREWILFQVMLTIIVTFERYFSSVHYTERNIITAIYRLLRVYLSDIHYQSLFRYIWTLHSGRVRRTGQRKLNAYIIQIALKPNSDLYIILFRSTFYLHTIHVFNLEK